MSEDIFGCHGLEEGATGIQWVEAGMLVPIITHRTLPSQQRVI